MATLSLGRRDTTSYFVSGLGYLVCRSTKIFHSKLGRLAGGCGVHPRNILEFQKNESRTRKGDPGCTGSYWRHRQMTANTFSKMVALVHSYATTHTSVIQYASLVRLTT